MKEKRGLQLLFVGHRSSHHATHSGYMPLATVVRGTLVPEAPIRCVPWRVQKRMAQRVPGPYSAASFCKELHALRYMVRWRPGTVHFFNGEQGFYYTRYWARRLGWRTVATFHKPPSLFRELIPRPSYLGSLDVAVCVGMNQVDYLKTEARCADVRYVPLGVDTSFFHPLSRADWHDRSFLFVGQHLRDFELLSAVIDGLRCRFSDLRVTAIVRSDHAHLVPQRDYMIIRSGISDEELRSEYRSASLLLLPLKDCTACDALLEAMACGVPVVATDVGGVRGYVNSDCAFLCPPGEADEMIYACSQLMTDTVLNGRMRARARERACDFSWDTLAQTMQAIYED